MKKKVDERVFFNNVGTAACDPFYSYQDKKEMQNRELKSGAKVMAAEINSKHTNNYESIRK